jgi:hypothetical protein
MGAYDHIIEWLIVATSDNSPTETANTTTNIIVV